MNTKEKKMFDILIELKEKFNVFSAVSYTHLTLRTTPYV